MNKRVTYPPVVVAWTEVSFPDVQSFSKKTFAVIGAFDVIRLRDEFVMNVPWIPTLVVWISMFVAFTDWIRPVSTQLKVSGSRWTYPDSNWHI